MGCHCLNLMGMICIPIMGRDTSDALRKIAQASTLGDLMEVRLDVMDSFDLSEIIRSASKPVIITYRSEEEGGWVAPLMAYAWIISRKP